MADVPLCDFTGLFAGIDFRIETGLVFCLACPDGRGGHDDIHRLGTDLDYGTGSCGYQSSHAGYDYHCAGGDIYRQMHLFRGGAPGTEKAWIEYIKCAKYINRQSFIIMVVLSPLRYYSIR